MRLAKYLCPALATFAYLAISTTAHAEGRNPGSLLIYPEFDNRAGNLTMFTVTNTNLDDTHDQSTNLPTGTVDVHFIYVGRFDIAGNPINCLEHNTTTRLTPGDTFTFMTSAHNPAQQRGFMFAYAQHPTSHEPIDFDYLIGNALFVSGIDAIDYSTNPIALKGETGSGNSTDTDGDQNRDLDGSEYEALPDEILVPRFLATGGALRSELIFLGLSGGAAFQTVAQLEIYNDNEEMLSGQWQFQCWSRVPLDVVSGFFTNTFLKTTNHAANEPLGATARESGWIKIYGDTAFSSVEQIDEPAIYAVLVERVSRGAGAADLPFECGHRYNGSLWPNGPLGDGVLGDNR